MPSLETLLEESRRELLDLTTRNRLLALPVESKSARVIHGSDEKSDHVFRMLVGERKSLAFLPGEEATARGSKEAPARSPAGEVAGDEEAGLPQPDEEMDARTGMARRHVDSRLQTTLTSDGLQRRLLALYRDARLMMEEQGVNILFLALGQLKWFEREKPNQPRSAPLVLVPVQLRRPTARERFTLTWREEDVQENLSLAAKLRAEFGIELPRFPLEEELVPSRYAAAVAGAVASQAAWEVLPDAITLGFFSFAKFLMYRDLDSRNWPDPGRLLNGVLGGLLRDGFPASEPALRDDANLDEFIPAARLDHVVDADSSQTIAIENVRAGRSLVVQGPPGTGKSQSITNLIATAVLDGRTVLFVAEKLAALEVVKRRLEAAGLGDLCLELHSHKAHKRAVIEELGRTWQLHRPRGQELESVVARLEQSRARLNAHAAGLHAPIGSSGITAFSAFGALALLGERGRTPGDVEFPGAESWDVEGVRERRALVAELARRAAQMGSLANHPWRGAERPTVLNLDLPRICERVSRLAAAMGALRVAANSLAARLRQPEPQSLDAGESLWRRGVHAAAAPPLDASAIGHPVWDQGLAGLREGVDHGRSFEELRSKLAGRVTDQAFEVDLSQARMVVAAHGKSLIRFLNGEYRRGLAQLRGVSQGTIPGNYRERVGLLDDLVAARRHRLGVEAIAGIGREAFGTDWRDLSSDWTALSAIVEWVRAEAAAGVGSEFRKSFGQLEAPRTLAPDSAALEKVLGEAFAAAQEVVGELALNLSVAFGVPELKDVPLPALEQRLGEWTARMEDLTRWNAWFVRASRARELGLGAVVEGLESDALAASQATDAFERSYYARLVREAVRVRPKLAQFDGLEQDRRVEEFRRIDLDRLTLAKFRVLAKHHERLPARHAGAGATGILLGELERKRGHRPVRKLLRDAGSVVQAIKPVFMMSPLSVAQFLEPGALEFDLLVIDEASQVQPVDAFGAFARAKQHVVVGDSRQLPPTRFFARLTSDEESAPGMEGDEPAAAAAAAQAKDVESILGLCCARGMPETMLRWHYRSRHHSLIAISNREFYEDRLFIVPSPHLAEAGLGLSLRFVEGGVYDRGVSGTNRVEARAVCRSVSEHARQSPGQSLGVAAFSVRQQQAILDELELLRREQPELEGFFHAHPHEPFFVKNLENVQGDERDVVFISVGYGPDAGGQVAMNFGPLGSDGGERRLNVLISRARRKCVVFTSLRSQDIDLARVSGRGVQAFKAYLEYAETGRLGVTESSARAEECAFEEAVRRAVESLGFEVHPRVGVAGFFVDLGVVDPKQPGRYVLGIECDGETYRDAKSARDRDRLRQAVLADHGWILHRVWSTDWFQRPGEQLRRVAAAIEEAMSALAESESESESESARSLESDAPEAAIEREAESAEAEPLSTPYVEAQFAVPEGSSPQALSPKEMADVLLRIVRVEGPIHEDEVTARVRDLWDLGRAGSRVQDSVARGIRALLVAQRCRREDDCLFDPGVPVPVRNREAVRAAGLRKPDLLPAMELRAAIERVVAAHHGATARELVNPVARVLGFKTTSGPLRERIAGQVSKLTAAGRLVEQEGLLRAPATNPEGGTPT